MAKACGFPEERFDEVFITLDKMDKIGLDGVEKELIESGFGDEAAQQYAALFEGLNASEDPLSYLEEKLAGVIEEDVIPNLRETIQTVEATKQADFRMVFDPTIVRGMSYYTGTIFEIAMPELGISAGGGGRYDGMVGKFTGKDVPACGFSIGFERIILILLEQGFQVPGKGEKVAFLLEKNLPGDRLKEAIEKAQQDRAEGKSVLVVRMNKNKKFQKQQLESQGYTAFEEFYAKPL
jgi:histidyl-tRNA synthetase